MNKIFKYCSMLLLSVLALTLGSCTEEYEYSGAKAEGQQVYFSSELPSTQNLSSTESGFEVKLNRIKTDEALTINLTLSDESGIYSIPSSVSFAEGESETTFTVGYDPTKLEYDVFNSVTIAIADADYTTPYGMSSYSFSAGMPSPYVSLGVGQYADNAMASGYADVEIMRNANNPNEIRIMHPYDDISAFLGSEDGGSYPTFSETLPEYLQLYILQPGDVNPGTGQTVETSDFVYFDEASTGVDLFGLGAPTYIWHPSLLQGGTLTNCRVLAWQEDGTPGQIQLAPFYIEPNSMRGQDMSGNSGVIVITFPGYEPKDYSVRVNYLGAFSSADGISYAIGNVTLGEDIEEAQVAVVEGSDVNNALNQVLSGAVETTTVTESGEVRIPCEYNGECTMVAIAYAEGEMQNYSTASFTFSLTPSEWRSLGMGLYTDYIIGPNYISMGGTPENPIPAPEITYAVEVQENINTPGVYRIMQPFAPENNKYIADVFGSDSYDATQGGNIIINASDPDAVYIQAQSTGVDYGNGYGFIYMMTVGGDYIDAGYPFDVVKDQGLINGKLENGVISFAAQEMLTAPYAMLSQGQAIYANTEDVDVLILPSAVTAQAKANATKTVNAIKRMKLSKIINRNTIKLSKNNKFKIAQKYAMNQNAKLNRK